MSSNFLQWDPSKTNAEDDAAYLADTQRSGGAAASAIFASQLANKLFYQLSTGLAAFMQSLANKGYTVSDADLTALSAVLAGVLTQKDPIASLVNVSVSGNVTFGPAWIIEDALVTGLTRTLYTAIGHGNFIYTLKNSSGGGSQTIDAFGSELIDGVSSLTFSTFTTLACNGTGWVKIG